MLLCKFCNKGKITREEFKVIKLGYLITGTGPKHIHNILPVCFNCNYNYSSRDDGSNKYRRLCINIHRRQSYVEQYNLVSLDEMAFYHNNIDKLFPIL